MDRVPISKEQLQEAVGKVMFEITKETDRRGNHSFASSHECLGVIDEEIHELKAAIRSNDRDAVRAELRNIATAAIWSLASEAVGGWDW